MFRKRRRTTRRGLATDQSLHKRRAAVRLDQTPLSDQTPPREQLTGRQSIPPRRRRNLSSAIVALRHAPLLLYQRPTAPGTRRDHFEPRHLRHRRMVSHTTMSSSSYRIRQGGTRRRDTFKTWIVRFHSVATKHLGSYLCWRRMIEKAGQHSHRRRPA